jgi:hypothetical protein
MSETPQTAFFFLGTFSFCAYNGKKKKWTNGLGVYIVVGSQPFCNCNPKPRFL